MANFNRTDLKANNALLINDNSSEDITPEDVRDALNNNSDSNVNRLSDPYFKYLGTTAGTTTAYTLTNSTDYPGDAYNNTVYFALEFNANNGVNPTLNINSLGAKDIYLNTTTQVTAADTLEAGSRYIAVYNSSLDAILLVLVFDSIGQTSPGGSNGDIQINDAGSFGATSDITISSGDVSIPNGDLNIGSTGNWKSLSKYANIRLDDDSGIIGLSLQSASGTKNFRTALFQDSANNQIGIDVNWSSGNPDFVIQKSGVNSLVIDSSQDVSIPNGTLTVSDQTVINASVSRVLNATRQETTATGARTILGLTARQTGAEMAGNYGAAIQLFARDATSGEVEQVRLSGYRDGADNTHGFLIETQNAGVRTDALDIEGSGNVSIPNGDLIVSGDITAEDDLVVGNGSSGSNIIINTSATTDPNIVLQNNGTSRWTILSDQSNSNLFRLFSNSGTGDIITAEQAGNVSIPNGTLKLDQYGSGTNTGTTAYLLAVDSSGNVIEESLGITQTEGTYTATASTGSSGITLGALSRLEYTKTGDIYLVSGLISITTTSTGIKTFSINPSSVLPNIPEQAMTGSVADRSGNIDFGQLVDNTPTGGSDIISITINVASTGSSAIQWMYTYNSAK